MTDAELRDLIKRCERIFAPSGPLHGGFDLISAGDLLLRGRDPGLARIDIERGLLEYEADAAAAVGNMTREQAINDLRACQKLDQPDAHIKADVTLCRLLRAIGYSDVADEYEKIENMWYE